MRVLIVEDETTKKSADSGRRTCGAVRGHRHRQRCGKAH